MQPFSNSPALAGSRRDASHTPRADDGDAPASGRRRELDSGQAMLRSRARDFQAHLRSAANGRARFNARCGEGGTIENAVPPGIPPLVDSEANEHREPVPAVQDNAVLLVAALAAVQPPSVVVPNPVAEVEPSPGSVLSGSVPVLNGPAPMRPLAPEGNAMPAAAVASGETSSVEVAPEIAPEVAPEITSDSGGGLTMPIPDRTLEKPSGTAAAKQLVPMKNAVEMENNAGAGVQNLPAREFVPEEPARLFIDRRAELRDNVIKVAPAELTTPLGAPTPAAPVQPTTPAAAPAEAVHASRAAERVADAVLRGVAEVRHTGAQELAVILRPDADTELLLRVWACDGTMQAQLRLERGDRAPLEAHWADLQQRMAQQGVQLSLADSPAFGGGGSSHPDPRHLAPEGSPAVPNLIGRGASVATTPVTAPRRSNNLFDQWA